MQRPKRICLTNGAQSGCNEIALQSKWTRFVLELKLVKRRQSIKHRRPLRHDVVSLIVIRFVPMTNRLIGYKRRINDDDDDQSRLVKFVAFLNAN